MKEAYIEINSVPTHIMCWGKWIEESFDNETKEIAICITGNPGLVGFYSKFMHKIHENLNIPVWCIGHAGHDEPPSTSLLKTPELKGNENLFDLNGQIQHKLKFIETYVPKNVKIHLIGHSIGAWMILELLSKESIKNRIKKCYLLFPTLERMAESKNGKFFENFVVPIHFILHFFVQLLYKMPLFIKITLIYAYFWIFSIPNIFCGTALKYSKPECMGKVFFLALDEMKLVQTLNNNAIKDNIDLLKLYYGRTDGWVPVPYYNEIKEKFPNLDCELDNKNIAHAFVLRSSDVMAEMVSDWINKSMH